MKRKTLSKLIVIVSLVVALAMVVPFMSGCLGAPAAAPPEAAPPAEAPPEAAPPAAPPKEITAKIGFCAPLSGDAGPWGLPGLWGDEIWVDRVNEAGGIELSDGTRVMIELVPYDNEYIADKALTGAKKLVLEDEVVLVQMLGGHTAAANVPWLTSQKMLSTTLLTGDLNPETLYHLAPSEVCPYQHIINIPFIVANYPGPHRLAIAVQEDELGIGDMVTHHSAAEALGVEVVYSKFYDVATTDFAPIVDAMLAGNPTIIKGGAYAEHINEIVYQLYLRDYEGLCVPGAMDNYLEVVDRTSAEFLEGYIIQFPLFDDPALTPDQNEFYYEYDRRHPGQWGAVSWEYASHLDIWAEGVKKADSIDPMEVFVAIKASPTSPHAFGTGVWKGNALWGIDNALMSDWPIVQLKSGVPRITAWMNPYDWTIENYDIVMGQLENFNVAWYQRMGLTKEEAKQQYPDAFPFD